MHECSELCSEGNTWESLGVWGNEAALEEPKGAQGNIGEPRGIMGILTARGLENEAARRGNPGERRGTQGNLEWRRSGGMSVVPGEPMGTQGNPECRGSGGMKRPWGNPRGPRGT